MRTKFDAQLEKLCDELIQMGALIESAIANAAASITQKNIEIAKHAIEYDAEVDRKEKEIESLCLKLLLQQQPVASDLRLISSALKMITDMERIGDQAADIAEIAMTLGETMHIEKISHISEMARETISMVNKSVDAFVKRDINLAYEVVKSDDIVDNLFLQVKDDIITMIRENVKYGAEAMDILMVAKYFERIGDHATNIAEWVEFSITGNHKSM